MTRLRSRVPNIFRDAQTYIHQRVQSLDTNRYFESTKKPVKQWLETNGEEDDDGNKVYQFPSPIKAVDDKVYSGVMLRKSVGSAFMDEKEVMALIASHDSSQPPHLTPGAIYDRVFKQVRVMDMDEVYVLQQEGIITEDELRSLLHYPKPSYSLWPVEATDPLEDEDD